MEFLFVFGLFFLISYWTIKIMAPMFWRSDLGDMVEVPKEQQDRIKNIGYSRNITNQRAWESAAEDAVIKAKLMEEQAREMLTREIRAVKNGEMRVVEVKAASEHVNVVNVPEDAPAVKNGLIGEFLGYEAANIELAKKPETKSDRIGYDPDFYTP